MSEVTIVYEISGDHTGGEWVEVEFRNFKAYLVEQLGQVIKQKPLRQAYKSIINVLTDLKGSGIQKDMTLEFSRDKLIPGNKLAKQKYLLHYRWK